MIKNTSIDSLTDINGESIEESISNIDNTDIDNINFLDSGKELETHDDGDKKPWVLISSEINEATECLLETRMITIDGVDITYVISITEKWKGKVNDCQVKDSYKIDNLDIINKFIDIVIFSYPDLVKYRRVKREIRISRDEAVKISYYWERLAHNYVYYLVKEWKFDEYVKEKPYFKKILYKIRDWVWHVDLDVYEIPLVQSIYAALWRQYLYILKKKK